MRRSCEIEVSKRRTQPLRFGRHPDLLDIPGEVDPLDCQRRLVGKRTEQPMLIGAEQSTRAIIVECRRQRPDRVRYALEGTAALRRAMYRRRALPADRAASTIWQPRGRPHPRCLQADRPRASQPFRLGEQQDDVDLEHRGDLECGRPQQIVERDRSGELAGEQIQILGRLRALPGGDRLARVRAARLLAITATTVKKNSAT